MRTSWMLIAVSLVAAAPALAQVDFDGSLPDASSGQGGPDRTSEENDPTGPCLTSADCNGGTCESGRCVPPRVRNASCGGGLAAVLPSLALLGLLVGRRRSRPRRR